MRYFLFIFIFSFYIFFFARAFLLSRSLGTTVKAESLLLNLSIVSAGVSSVIFIAYLLYPQIGVYLYIITESDIIRITGSVFIIAGLAASTFASLSMKKSWRIGIIESDKIELVTNGIYSFSRNPYFLSYDMALIGMAIFLLSPFLVITVLITLFLFHLMILKEEKYLEKQHNEIYRKYKKKVRRYI